MTFILRLFHFIVFSLERRIYYNMVVEQNNRCECSCVQPAAPGLFLSVSQLLVFIRQPLRSGFLEETPALLSPLKPYLSPEMLLCLKDEGETPLSGCFQELLL